MSVSRRYVSVDIDTDADSVKSSIVDAFDLFNSAIPYTRTEGRKRQNCDAVFQTEHLAAQHQAKKIEHC